ncbi:MAG: DUF6048 family protein [Bacteroidota bacterium]
MSSSLGFSQSEEETIVSDSTVIKQKYGLRLGGDLGKLVRTLIDDDYSGFEVIGDFRLTNKIYFAGEIGIEENTTSTDFINSTAQGTYLKVGIDYNLYQNWLNMDNMIFAGFRIGGSSFSQTLNSYSIYDVNNQYWPNNLTTINANEEFSGLTASWIEIIIGIKAEVLPNLYAGLNVQLKGLISDSDPDNFENLWIPGFNRTFDSGLFGTGFGYTLSYRIPVYKKEKIIYQN